MVNINKFDIYKKLLNITKEKNIKQNEPMNLHTSFKIGGIADWYITLDNLEEIKAVLKLSKEKSIPIFVIGNGTNLLVKDNGIRGIVLKINLNKIKIEKQNCKVFVTVGSGIKLIPFCLNLAKEGIAGLEFASGIPGTIGGAVYMNAGAYGREMKDVVVSTKYMDYDGNIFEINNNAHEFNYRSSVFSKKQAIILETTLSLIEGKQEEINSKIQEYKNKRLSSQPVDMPNAGSTFKRGEDFIAAKLIDDAGLKGYSVGDAEISQKHAGFVVNKGNATASDVLKLVEHVKKEVYNKFKKNIELEIKIIGE